MVTKRIPNPLNEEFENLVAETLEKWHVPGMSIAVVDGENTWAKVPIPTCQYSRYTSLT